MSRVSALVVNDAPFIRDLMKKGSHDNLPGLHTKETANGRKAQQLFGRQNVNLTLCNWEMPKISSLELLTWCHVQEDLKIIPFIMVTSRGGKEDVVQAIQAGVPGYIGKSFSNDQLVVKIKKALSHNGKLGALATHAPRREIASDMASDSLTALAGGHAKVVKLTANPAEPTPAPKPASALQASARPTGSDNPLDQTQLCLPQSSVPCAIKVVSLKGAQLMVRRADSLPQVLESAVLDPEENSDVAHLNGCLHAIAALEPKSDSNWLLLTLRFVDRDPQKLDYLSYLIARGSTQEHYAPSA